MPRDSSITIGDKREVNLPSELTVVFEYWEQEDIWIPVAFITSKLDKFHYLKRQEANISGPKTIMGDYSLCPNNGHKQI